MPLRRSITTLDRGALRAEALAAFGLEPGRRTLLVFGGSLGAQRLNAAFGASAPALARAGVQVLHSAGRGKAVEFPAGFDPAGPPVYREVEYLDRMDLAYAAADLVACRAGAGTVSELSAIGLPAAYVPLPHGNGEQRLNAQPLVDAGGGLVVDDAACTADWVASSVDPLLAEPGRLAAKGRAAAAFGIRDADERLADLVLRAAGRAPDPDQAGVTGGGAA
jgi:UDP-N-acetylglucosamine--N-acetylmuramyl-(pentapeptide) pyrophosphoryl-undecaprenol N-acetylglucosamine transferase